MKNIKIVMIVLLSCLMLYLCITLGIVLYRGDSSSWHPFGPWNSTAFQINTSYSLAQETEFTADYIDSIGIDFGMNSNDVFFYQGEGDSILIREYLNFSPKEEQLSSVTLDGSRLSVKGKRRSSFSFFAGSSPDGYLEVYLPVLPEHTAESAESWYFLDLLQIKTVSGDISSEISFDLSEKFSASSTSGDIFFPGIKAVDFQCSSTSGSLRLVMADADMVSFTTTSGDIYLEQATGTVKLSSTSGDITLERTDGNVTVSTTSGDISLADTAGDMAVTSTSGEVRLGMTEGNLSLATTSGDIILQSGNGSLEAETVSGDIRADSQTGPFQLNTTSGFLSLGNCAGEGRAHSISGDIRLWLQELTGDLSVSTTSGFVDCKLPADTSLSLEFKSTSGECNTFFDDVLSFNKKGNQASGQYGTTPAHAVSVSTTSGDLRILEY